MKAAVIGYSLLAGAMAVAAAAGGYWLGQQRAAPGPAAAQAQEERAVLYWYDPMKPDQHFDQPGKSPFMDMQLVPKYAGSQQDSAALSVAAETVQNLGMRTAKVLRATLPMGLEAVGSLAYNQRDIARLQARSSGFVERVYGHAPGDVLAAGTPLVDLLIPAWSAAQLEFIAVLESGDARLIEALRERLRLLGMSTAQIERLARSRQANPLQTLVTPIAGELQTLEVRSGMSVAAGQDLALINGLSSVWLDTAIPEAQAALVQLGAEVQARLAAYPGEDLQGRVIALLPSTDVQTRTLTVRSEFANPQGRLRPGMFASVRLNGASQQPVLLIPSEAVLRTGKRALVMLAEGAGRYRPLEVQLGREADGRTEVRSGLAEGQEVVTSGQFLLDSEASLQGILARLEEAEPRAPMAALHEAQGVIRALDGHYVTLEHGPFASLSMPGMTMQFPLARPEVAAGLQVGDRVAIGARMAEDGLLIERLAKQGAGQ